MNVTEEVPGTAKVRNSNLEILRILCMVFIVAYHAVGSTQGYLQYPQLSTGNLVMFHWIGLWGQAAVICFVMITGYFMIEGKVKLSKILRLVAEVWFYSIIITALMVYFGVLEFDYEVALRTFFPIITREYWFVTDYIVLLLLVPVINKVLRTISKRELEYVLAVLLMAAFFFSGLYEYEFITTIPMFVMFYSLAAYIRMYPNRVTENRNLSIVVLFLCMAFGLMLVYAMNDIYQGTAEPLWLFAERPELLVFFALSVLSAVLVPLLIPRWKTEALVVTVVVLMFAVLLVYMPYRGLGIRGFSEERYSMMTGLFAVSLFLVFKNMKPRHSKAVNWLAGGTLSVYLIHNQWYFSKYYWEKLVEPDILFHDHMVMEILALVLAIVLACLLVDKVRAFFFGIVSRFGPVRKVAGIIDDWYSRIITRC